MRRADRLLMLLQILRRHRQPVSADTIARELEVSVRTVYRDIAGLVGDGVPIRGEAGIGYVLGQGYDLPPLMFTADEIEAVQLGMRWVEGRAEPALARAARDVLAKVGAVLPPHLRPVLLEATLDAPRPWEEPPAEQVDVGQLRLAIRERRKIAMTYCDEAGARTERIVWPLAIGYFELSRLLIAWCELRGAWRHFRTDRILDLAPLERYKGSRGALLARWQREAGSDRVLAPDKGPATRRKSNGAASESDVAPGRCRGPQGARPVPETAR